ncbi:DUF2155 domain-containing protein [Loktanella sp. M215]|uniref:DUF2155 domain-containing protein n=1 Tax=Loktanella sp. M215 TaxID=2675431 RepID=UPI001F16A23B|nr:DUF2155 domain-containing protein [Loktanella sp. M215]MBU2360245.1 DUF2155 domain-containing protein [Alphaproteobacteria bacterium]MCF7699808.1 DUF2155 domain-containing protein [Loktanella sp. M215]
MIRALALCLTLLPGLAAAQQASSLPGGMLRVLDKVTGHLTDLELKVGQSEKVGSLLITMNDCRVPADNPTGDAFAELKVNDRNEQVPVFDGWMIASAPALNAMDHPRYDVWVMRCEAT